MSGNMIFKNFGFSRQLVLNKCLDVSFNSGGVIKSSVAHDILCKIMKHKLIIVSNTRANSPEKHLRLTYNDG